MFILCNIAPKLADITKPQFYMYSMQIPFVLVPRLQLSTFCFSGLATFKILDVYGICVLLIAYFNVLNVLELFLLCSVW